MHDHLPWMDERADRVMSQRIKPAITRKLRSARVECFEVPGIVPGAGEPIAWSQARLAQYKPVELPLRWGPPWGTTWFRVTVDVPEHEPGQLEMEIDLGWQNHSPGFQAEGLVYEENGRVVKGLHPLNHWVPVPDQAGEWVFYIEAASNPLLLDVPPFIPTQDGDKETASVEASYTFKRCDLVEVHAPTRELYADLDVITKVAAEWDEKSPRRWRLAYAVQDALNALDTENVRATADQARAKLAPLFELPADADAMQITAVGHAHIDSAWLWPLRETRRKVARTLANFVALLERGSKAYFALPAAQHLEWLKEDQPELWDRVKHWIEQGQIVPVGGMWVEPDAVLPGGEAMCRQLIYGQRYFEREFGQGCHGVWLPDSFGYSAALPQLARLGGASWFLTQKISWNKVNVFPHNTFYWEGIDGTRIFTHFPAADTYNSDLSPKELFHAVSSYKERGKGNSTLVPFGYGDGGGGPTREMLDRADRMSDLAGAPRVRHAHPDLFFAQAEAELAQPAVWVGELYLELHRGTFTSQVATKQGNRRNEALIREAELWWATAAFLGLADYPYDWFEEAWKPLLLGQFHDILPGTSIAWVHRENAVMHAQLTAQLQSMIRQAQEILAGEGEQELMFNAAPITRCGVSPLSAAVPDQPVLCKAQEVEGGFVLENDYLKVSFNAQGLVTHLVHVESGRDAVAESEALGALHLIPDFPTMWDAWDVDSFQYDQPEIIDQADEVWLEGTVVHSKRVFRSSSVHTQWRLSQDGRSLDVELVVDWHEHDHLLKLALPFGLHTGTARYETQFGHIERAIHTNTSADAQRYEVSVHRWMHLAEGEFGVAVANAGSYGCDVRRHSGSVVVRPSLVRGPRFPDPRQDQGQHRFAFTICPGATLERAVALGYVRNTTPTVMKGAPRSPLLEVDGALIESVKLADDRSGDLIVRAYEHRGQRARAVFSVVRPCQAWACSLLEEPLTDVHVEESNGGFAVELHPFQVLTLRLRKKGQA